MLVGIMSDSHGDAAATAKAVKLLATLGAKKLFHCGDIGGEAVLDELAGHDCTFVWGNCDRPTPRTRAYVATLGLKWPEPVAHVELAGKRIAVCHGDEIDHSALVEDGDIDYLFHGHTHSTADHRKGRCRIINPGALHRAAIRTVATLDLRTDELRFYRVDTGREVPGPMERRR